MTRLAAVIFVLSVLTGKYEADKIELPRDYSVVDRNSTHVTIDHLRPRIQANEHDYLQLRCVVTLVDVQAAAISLTWTFLPATDSDGDVKFLDDKVVALARDGEVIAPDRKGVSVIVRHRWDAVADVDIEEHFLRVKSLSLSDEGIFSCQIHSTQGELLASRRTLVTVLPQHYVETASLHHSTDETSSSISSSANASNPTLGPITERYVVATRGTDVVLECRDSDNNWVYWKKQGDPTVRGYGKTLRLMRVDRWDSGLYYCSTNTTFAFSHNYTLQVDQAPKVKAPKVALQAVGAAAILSCEVEAVPVPQVVWYKLSTAEETLIHPIVSAKEKLEMGDEYSMAISTFKDGFMRASLHIRAVSKDHYGTYVCQAKNRLGSDSVEIRLQESAHVVAPSRDLDSAVSSRNGSGKTLCILMIMTIMSSILL